MASTINLDDLKVIRNSSSRNMASNLLQDLASPPNIVHVLNARQYGLKTKYTKQLEQRLEAKTTESKMKKTECYIPSSARSTFLMSFSNDCTKVASAHGDHNIYICDVETGQQLKALKGHLRTPWSIVFHPTSNEILASGCLAGEVRVWDLQGQCEKWKIDHDNDNIIASLAFHPTFQLLAIAVGNFIYFWDWSQPKPYAFCSTCSSIQRVRFVKFSHHHLITGIANLRDELNFRKRHYYGKSTIHRTGTRSPIFSQSRPESPRSQNMTEDHSHQESLDGSSLSEAINDTNSHRLPNSRIDQVTDINHHSSGIENSDSESSEFSDLQYVVLQIFEYIGDTCFRFEMWFENFLQDNNIPARRGFELPYRTNFGSNTGLPIAIFYNLTDAIRRTISFENASRTSRNLHIKLSMVCRLLDVLITRVENLATIGFTLLPDLIDTIYLFRRQRNQLLAISDDIRDYEFHAPQMSSPSVSSSGSVYTLRNNSSNFLQDMRQRLTQSGFFDCSTNTRISITPHPQMFNSINAQSGTCNRQHIATVCSAAVSDSANVHSSMPRSSLHNSYTAASLGQRDSSLSSFQEVPQCPIRRLLNVLVTQAVSSIRENVTISNATCETSNTDNPIQGSSSRSSDVPISNILSSSPNSFEVTPNQINTPSERVMMQCIAASTEERSVTPTDESIYENSSCDNSNLHNHMLNGSSQSTNEVESVPPNSGFSHRESNFSSSVQRIPRNARMSITPHSVTFNPIIIHNGTLQPQHVSSTSATATRTGSTLEEGINQMNSTVALNSDDEDDTEEFSVTEYPDNYWEPPSQFPLSADHRIQFWDFSQCIPPPLHNVHENIVVHRCMIHNDASVDISKDGKRLVALLFPEKKGDTRNFRFGIYSLESKSLGQRLCVWGYICDPVSLSFSPLGQYVMVGSGTSGSWRRNTRSIVVDILKICLKEDGYYAKYVRGFTRTNNPIFRIQDFRLNCVKWLPQMEYGIAYATNRGLLSICKPVASIIIPPEENGDILNASNNVQDDQQNS